MGEIHEERDEAERHIKEADEADSIDPPEASDDPDEIDSPETDALDPEGDDDPEADETVKEKPDRGSESVEGTEETPEETDSADTIGVWEKARDDQSGRIDYTLDNKWKDIELEGGTKLYRLDYQTDEGEIRGGNYFITEEQLIEGDYVSFETVEDENGDTHEEMHFDAEKYADDLQIKPFNKDGEASYSNHLSAFEVPEGTTIEAATGITEENAAYGRGGAEQMYIGKDEQAKLKPLDEKYVVDNRDVYAGAALEMTGKGIEIAGFRRRTE